MTIVSYGMIYDATHVLCNALVLAILNTYVGHRH